MNKCEDLSSDICKDTHSLVDTKKVVLASVDLNFCRGLPRGLGVQEICVQGACWGDGGGLCPPGAEKENGALRGGKLGGG